ncbi:MAG: hypothetical protein ACYSU0_18590, partial [Planctomycetota bacterium]
MPRLDFQPFFGFPTVFNAMETGLAIEDIWPSIYIGADSVDEMKRKTKDLPWARAALDRWRAEAETVLDTKPEFLWEKSSGRSAMFNDDGHYWMFDPSTREKMWD